MGEKVVILGGTGRMGRWLAKFLRDKGFDVAIYSRSLEKAVKTAEDLGVRYVGSLDDVREEDIVIVSTSLDSTAEMVRKVTGMMKPGTILFDIASVKEGIIEALEEADAFGIRVISVHPLFGPGTINLKGKRVIIVPVSKDSQLVKEIKKMFEGAEIHLVDSGKTHDMMVASTLALPHFLNIVFGKTLTHMNIQEVRKFAGTTFTLQLMIAEAVLNEDPDLYFEIQSRNKAFMNIIDLLNDSFKEVALAVKENDRDAFVKGFVKARNELSKDADFLKAYERFYKAYEAIA